MYLDGENFNTPTTQEEYEEIWEMTVKNGNKPLNVRPPESPPPAEEKKHFVFVYGSLMSGFGNHYHLENSKLLMSAATTLRRMKLIDLGAFPGVVKATTIPDSPQEQARFKSLFSPIKGEVYEVSEDTLHKSLDRLEGNGRFYTRELIEVLGLDKVDGGPSDGKAWMYILPKEYDAKYSACIPDETNTYCWRNHKAVLKAYQTNSERKEKDNGEQAETQEQTSK